MPKKSRKLKLGLKNLAMLPSYFDYIYVHLRQKAHLRPELSQKFVVNFRPEPDPKTPARLTTLKPTVNPIYLRNSCSHSASETSEEEVSPCSSKRIHTSNQIVSVQLKKNSPIQNPNSSS